MIIVVHGSGRAKCSICNRLIEVGENNQVNFIGYKTSERCHRDCIINYEQVMLIKQL